MELEGTLHKDGKFWLIEAPSLDIMTQGHTRTEALHMIRDAIMALIETYFEPTAPFDITVTDHSKNTIGISCTDNKLLLALSLRRQRENAGLSLREASQRLGSKSPNAYAQYERGKIRISFEQYEKLLQAVNPLRHPLLRII
jgi:predicted RNase H-like HicB family nuclease